MKRQIGQIGQIGRIGRTGRISVLLALCAVLLAAPSVQSRSGAEQSGGLVILAAIEGAIEPNTERYLSRVIEAAEDEGAPLVIRIDTPGGLGSSMRNLVEQLFAARIPTVAFVSPPGAQAASAGTLVAAAANIAAMAPGTNIGAAAPISGSGEDLPPTLRKKVDEDTTALVRSIADLRGRAPEPIEATVLEALAYTAAEALELDVIDLIADDLPSLLAAIDGITVETADGAATLQTAGAEVREIGRSMVERFLEIITNPTVVYTLVLLGTYGVIYEIRDPGNFGPGVLGIVGLVLGFAGIGLLPVNLTGVILLVAGVLLMLLESQLEGFGWAGLGAVICWALAGFLLFGELFPEPSALDDPLEISRWVIGVFAAVGLAFIALLWALGQGGGMSEGFMLEEERRWLDRDGRVREALNPNGLVEIDGQMMTAMIEGLDDLPAGAAVTVISVYAGGVLKVMPRAAAAAQRAAQQAELTPSGWRRAVDRLSLSRLLSRLLSRPAASGADRK